MLTKSELSKLESIETTCRILLEKCYELKTQSAPPFGGASKKKTKRQLLSEEIDKDLEKSFERMFKQS